MVASDTRQVGRNIRAVKTGEMIASFLRSKIVRGEFAEGDSLPPEAELMRQFEVSRPTLREAFRILETESLIVIRRGCGTVADQLQRVQLERTRPRRLLAGMTANTERSILIYRD